MYKKVLLFVKMLPLFNGIEKINNEKVTFVIRSNF
jgi:hypothetical protein